jgi:hypothetical protein
VLAVERGRILGPQLLESREILVCDLAAFFERRAQQREFLLHPPGASAEDEAAVGEHVDCRQHFRGENRGAVRHHHDRGKQPQAFGAAGEERHGGELVEAIAVLGGGEHAARRVWIFRRKCAGATTSSLTDRESNPARSAATATAL